MRTQISNLRSGTKNQILNDQLDYSKGSQATSHIGHAGTNKHTADSVWEKVTSENPESMKIQLWNQTYILKANWSLSRKSVNYTCTIDRELAKKYFPHVSKRNNPTLSISHSTAIEITNGGNGYMSVCPSLVKIL